LIANNNSLLKVSILFKTAGQCLLNCMKQSVRDQHERIPLWALLYGRLLVLPANIALVWR